MYVYVCIMSKCQKNMNKMQHDDIQKLQIIYAVEKNCQLPLQ